MWKRDFKLHQIHNIINFFECFPFPSPHPKKKYMYYIYISMNFNFSECHTSHCKWTCLLVCILCILVPISKKTCMFQRDCWRRWTPPTSPCRTTPSSSSGWDSPPRTEGQLTQMSTIFNNNLQIWRNWF